MALKAVQFEFEIAEVPEGDSLVRGASGEDELGVRVETEAVDLGRMSVHGVGRPVGDGRPGVPDHQLLVISHGPEQRLVEEMPGNILHDCGVP